jgi:hypothetical protein
MLTRNATFNVGTDGFTHDIMITPLFLKNHKQPWQPNEIYELSQEGELHNGVFKKFNEPLSLGKIIVDDHLEWYYEGEHGLAEEDIEKIAQFVLAAE